MSTMFVRTLLTASCTFSRSVSPNTCGLYISSARTTSSSKIGRPLTQARTEGRGLRTVVLAGRTFGSGAPGGGAIAEGGGAGGADGGAGGGAGGAGIAGGATA